ncbi:MAG: hypothetical protein LBG14_01975 [Treponema sp.]|jgi:hypothetical protein|nr:hypothetical protein [Treponema sp.]
MKLTRPLLLWIALGLGFFLLAYGLFRHFSGIMVDPGFEKILIDGVIFAALGLFIYNRKLAGDEKKERERREREAAEDKGTG